MNKRSGWRAGREETAAHLSPEENVSRAIMHRAEGAHVAVLMLSGAVGGTNGPSGIYEELALRLQSDGITALRLKYRGVGRVDECVLDALAAIEALKIQGVQRVVLIGWSFGGAVAITAGAANEMVVGVVTIASQKHRTEAIAQLPPKSLLLIHGTADAIIPVRCAHELYALAGEPKSLVLYQEDDHFITLHASEMLEKLHRWSVRLSSEINAS
jgi:alpha/beta superfamily hydrolase